LILNSPMDQLPKKKKRSDRTGINISIETAVRELYDEANKNGWDAPEIARRAVTEAFLRRKEELRRPAS
jgi:hypothetical protein